MRSPKIPLAILYDFDGTLAPGNMQEWDFLPGIGMRPAAFWREVKDYAAANESDEILSYMQLMLRRASERRVPVRKSDFEQYGRTLPFFPGVLPYEVNGEQKDGWFDRINVFADGSRVKVEHYVVSSGLREIVTGSPIGGRFKKIYASGFAYDENGVAEWPALALNYTTKTQYIFRINKGTLDVHDNSIINNYVRPEDRPVPFSNMIYIGDGVTDVPCFRLVKDQGGHAVAVYQPRKPGGKGVSERLRGEGRVNFVASADYREKSLLDQIVKSIIEKLATDAHLQSLANRLR